VVAEETLDDRVQTSAPLCCLVRRHEAHLPAPAGVYLAPSGAYSRIQLPLQRRVEEVSLLLPRRLWQLLVLTLAAPLAHGHALPVPLLHYGKESIV
jgi:hypothetical protein